MSMGRFWN